MEPPENKKAEIIGFGLAGAVLSWQFYWQKRSFIVRDSGVNHTTRTAAGLINPVVFRKLTKSWLIDDLLPSADAFYSRVEKELDTKLLSRKSINRVFASVEEVNNWSSKIAEPHFAPYIEFDQKVQDLPYVSAPYGAGKVKTIGHLDTIAFLDLSRSFFLDKGIHFAQGMFDYQAIETGTNYFFCEGAAMKNNPYFNYLPITGTHGDALVIESDEINFDEVLNRNMFILPLGGNRYKIGATYRWHLEEPTPTEEGAAEILEKMRKFTSFSFKIVERWAGIRPSTQDRKPLIGKHHERSNLFLFNGLGTKGVMIAPYFSQQMDQLAHASGTIHPEANIDRFAKLRPVSAES